VTEPDPFDGDTNGAVVVGVAVEGVAVEGVVVADVPEVALLLPLVELVDVDELDVAVVAGVLVDLVLTVLPPAWAASPANRPVPATAPASDHRVIFLIRRRPASRSCLVRSRPAPPFADTGFRGPVSMLNMVAPGHVNALVAR
jgi:hypothetical protein